MSGTRARSARYGERPPLTRKQAFTQRQDPDEKSGWKRVTPPNDKDGLAFNEVLVAEFSNPDLYRLAATIPPRARTKPGCPRDYPDWALMAYGHLAAAYSSHRKVQVELRLASNWDLVLRTVAQTAGQHVVDALRPKARHRAPNRSHWNYWLKQHKHLWPALNDAYTPMAVAQAQDMGLLDPDAAVTYHNPSQRNTVYGDGKVMSSPVRHRPQRKKTASLRDAPPKRTDPASAFWHEGGDDGQDAHGTKFVFASVRGPGYLNRVCLAMDLQYKGGPTEAAIGVDQVKRLVELAGTGVRAVAWDGAFNHVHIDDLMRNLGLVVISPVKAKSNPDGVRSGHKSDTRIEKEAHVETLEFRTPHGYCRHALYARGGRMGQQVTDAASNKTWQPLPIRALNRGEDKNTYRWYHLTDIPCDVNGDHEHRVPLVQSSDDTAKGLLRSEYLRQLPPDTQGYERTYGTRPAAESDNSGRERRYTWHRLPAYGQDAQAMVMLGWNFLENSKARYLHRLRQQQAQDQHHDQAAA